MISCRIYGRSFSPLPKQNKSLIQTASSLWSYGLLPYGACYLPSHTFADRRDLAVAYSLAERRESPEIPSEHHTWPMFFDAL